MPRSICPGKIVSSLSNCSATIIALWPLYTRGSMLNINPPQSSVTNTMDSLLDLTEAGMDIALLPDFMVCDAIAAGKLTLGVGHVCAGSARFCILWPSSRHTAPKIKHSSISWRHGSARP
ncbi:hypothetical protein HOY34_07155 [Xinfangfangia sp. D13-10-4-6]|uniref:LysR substrate-binding domain-containing protein n=1 Tax=Pseudogemmobacter hezensis TaxID=2737662 RepID=UPI0015518418|nr:LysR substrate-binding domain-containing protein [Pseudogemmobacter hezensis]NPD14982.1 hypothetical protein [Pseudogemmobacter hezensis]